MRLLRLGLLLGLLGLLALGVVLETPLLEAGSGERLVDRVQGYEVGGGADPVFALSGGDTRLRLVTNAVVPASLGGEDAPYGVSVSIERPGLPPEIRPIHLKSHRTGARTGTADPVFDREGTPLADSRHVDLVLDPPAPPGTLVRVSELAGDGTVVLRAWTFQPREGESRARRRLALDPDQRRRLGDPIGVRSWDHLDAAERDVWTGGHFARLAANGRPGIDHLSRDFFVRAVEPPEAEADLATVVLQSPLTWLLTGPVDATVRVAPTALTVPTTVELRRSSGGNGGGGDETVLATWDLAPGATPQTWTGALPAGTQTLVLVAHDPTELHLDVAFPPEAAVSSAVSSANLDDPDEADPASPTPPTLGPPVSMPPATVTLRGTPVGPTLPAAVLDAELPADPELRTVEIEVWGQTAEDPTLTVSVDARHGAAGRVSVETLTPVLPENAYDVAVDALGVETPLRGPTRVKLLLPADAVAVRVASSTPALIRFRLPFHVSDADPGPPALLRQVGVGEGPAARSWVRAVSGPESPDEVEIRVKARIEPVPPPPVPPPTWLATSLDPVGLVQRFEALERVAGELVGRLLTEVNGALRVRAGTGQTRARFSFEVQDPALLGTSVAWSLDGAPGGTLRAALTRGTVRLPPLTPGEHTVEAHPPPGMRIFVNLPPAAGERASAYRARSVWRVRDPVELAIPTDGRGPRALDIVVYDRSTGPRDDVTVSVVVDGGTPRRRDHGLYTRSTPARRRYTLPAAAHPDPAVLVDGDRENIGFPRTLIVPLGDDLQPGRHTVRLQADRPLYMRFFAVMPPQLGDRAPTSSQEPEFSDE